LIKIVLRIIAILILQRNKNIIIMDMGMIVMGSLIAKTIIKTTLTRKVMGTATAKAMNIQVINTSI